MHILSTDQFTADDVLELIERAEYIRDNHRDLAPVARDRLLVNLFYEASTRTSSSFYAAMHKLGGSVLPINDVTYSSVSKGENLEDTVRTLACYADVLVLRHPEIGAAQRAAAVSPIPVVNAGDGAGEHPTQALLDIYTIWREQSGRLNGLDVTLMGDLRYGRTTHSLIKLLRNWDVKINLVSPSELTMPGQYITAGDRQCRDLWEVIHDTDVLYMTRVQKERFSNQEGTDLNYGVTTAHLASAHSHMTLMHPLPRNEEIPADIDQDPRAAYFRQMENGLWMRAALLDKILTQK